VKNMSKLTLDSVEWGVFRLKDLFEIENCKCSKVSGLEKGDIPYVGATNQNNGTVSYLKNYHNLLTKGNCIVFVCDGEGSMGYSFFKKEDFIGTTTIKVGRNKNLNRFNGMFISTVADTIRGKYNFGYKRNELRLKNETLTLPITINGSPNWKFMGDYIKQEMKAQSQKVINYYENKLSKLGYELLDLEVEWREFKVKDLFKVKPVKGKSITHYKEGKIPYITTSSVDNGLNNFIDTKDNISLKKCISIDPIGGKSFFHEYDFVGRGGAGSAINLLYNNSLDKYSGLFICKMLEGSSFSKASYGVQLNGNRLKNLKLLLPIDKSGEPHWEYMSSFIKKLEKENIEKILNYLYSYNR
jgi:Type I restriction modification DNA specificity domain.